MAELGDVDDVKQALARLLSSPQMLAKLSEITIAKGDGLLPRWPVFIFTEEHLTLNQFPAAELIAYRSNYDGEMVQQIEHNIGVRWTVVADTEERVTKDVERLVRATTDLLWNSTLDMRVSSGPIIVTEEDYSPLVPTVDYPFLKSGLVLLTVPCWRGV